MGLLDRLSAQRRSGFNASARGASPASGVKYFQENLVPGLSNLGAEAETPDAGFRATPVENIGTGGPGQTLGPQTDAYFNAVEEDRNLAELQQESNRNVIGAGLSMIPGGLGTAYTAASYLAGSAPPSPMDAVRSVMNANDAWETYQINNPEKSGLLPGQYQNFSDLWNGNGTFGDKIGRVNDFTAQSLAEAQANRAAREAEMDQNAQDAIAEMQAEMELQGPPASAAPASTGWDGGGGYNGAGYDAGPTGADGGYDTGDNGAGGYALADGGPVGLSISGYAEGGEVQGPLLAMGFADGGPMPSMGAVGNTPSPDMINMQVNQMARNPQFQQRVAQAIQPLMQSGELTPQEVQVMGQIAEASLQNPKLYPQLRQFVAQQGMSPLPPSFDPSVIVKILAITRALQGGGAGAPQPGQGQPTPPGQVPPTDQAQMQNPAGMANGGFLVGPGTGRSDSIGTVNESSGQPVKVANGEYVIPKHVVDAKGREFFDNLLRRYSELPKAEG